LRQLLREEVASGWTELSCHPGYCSPDFDSVYLAEREAEIRTLTNPCIRRTMDDLGIRLASYADYNALNQSGVRDSRSRLQARGAGSLLRRFVDFWRGVLRLVWDVFVLVFQGRVQGRNRVAGIRADVAQGARRIETHFRTRIFERNNEGGHRFLRRRADA